MIADKIHWEVFYGVYHELCSELVKGIDSDKKLLAICNTTVPRKCFLQVYRLFKKIEDLPEVEKKQLKDLVISSFPGRDKKWLVDSCKVVYTVSEMIK